MALSLVLDQAFVCLALDLLLLRERAGISMRVGKMAFSMVPDWELALLPAMLAVVSMVLDWELVLSLALLAVASLVLDFALVSWSAAPGVASELWGQAGISSRDQQMALAPVLDSALVFSLAALALASPVREQTGAQYLRAVFILVDPWMGACLAAGNLLPGPGLGWRRMGAGCENLDCPGVGGGAALGTNGSLRPP